MYRSYADEHAEFALELFSATFYFNMTGGLLGDHCRRSEVRAKNRSIKLLMPFFGSFKRHLVDVRDTAEKDDCETSHSY